MIAIVSGATSGFGSATAKLLAKNGYDLVITGRRSERLAELAKELLNKYQINVLPLVFDIQNNQEVEFAIDNLPIDFRKIDVLVNNAGLAAGLATIQDGSLADWEQMLDTNVKGLLYLSRKVIPLMIENKHGHIVNIGSIAGKEVYPNGNVYCASKFAVDALTKSMRIDLLPHGIKVTGIHPGMAETEFSLVRFKGDQERAANVYNGLEPLLPEDIASSILWVLQQPAHVNINEMVIMPTAQANPYVTHRKQKIE